MTNCGWYFVPDDEAVDGPGAFRAPTGAETKVKGSMGYGVSGTCESAIQHGHEGSIRETDR